MQIVEFRGHSKPCDSTEPHPPHRTGQYHTVRYGWLDDFCPGVAGAGHRIIGTRQGSAQVPAVLLIETAAEATPPEGAPERPNG